MFLKRQTKHTCSTFIKKKLTDAFGFNVFGECTTNLVTCL